VAATKELLATVALGLLLGSCGHRPGPSPLGEAAPPGTWARAIVSDSEFTRLVVTVDYVSGATPSPAALALLQQRLSERCRKPAGVTVSIGTEIASPGPGPYSAEELASLARTARRLYSSGSTLAVYVLYLDSESDDPAGQETLGVAFEATAFAVFQKAIASETALIGTSAENAEAAVLLHEMGHLMGLVDMGAPLETPHEDANHPLHCVNPSCVMHWDVAAASAGGAVGLAAIDYDDACKADLQANGGF